MSDEQHTRTEYPAREMNDRTTEFVGKTCFVIMPFQTKADREGRPINFDEVFNDIIRPAVQSAGLACEKADSDPGSGLMHSKFINSILRADVVIADTTTSNANVFYELGIRHTARPSGTIIICRSGTTPPFDTNGMLYIEYVVDKGDPAFLRCQQAISAAITAAITHRRTDSLVHTLVQGLNVVLRANPNPERKIFTSDLARAQGKRLGIITGDLHYIEDVDVWVNPESTRMEMARVHDDSVSATIRYLGAKLGPRGEVIKDIVADELARRIRGGSDRKKSADTIVEAATVVITESGQLKKSHKVKKIFHVAAQHGEPTKGYVTVRAYEDCVKRVLEGVDSFNRKKRWRSRVFRQPPPLRSIIFPLFGTRGPDRDGKDVAARLVQSAKTYLETWPRSSIEKVYFLAYTDADLELCETAFQRFNLKLVEQKRA